MKVKPKIIKTNRLVLKELSNVDQNDFIDIVSNEEVSLTYMLPIFKCKEDKIKLFKRFIELSNNLNRFVYGVYLNNKLIGFVNDVLIENDEIELGYVISPLYKNNGYATEALKGCVNVLFDMGYKTVKAGAFIDNIASQKVMMKSNMVKIDFVEDITYRDKTYKCVYYQITR